MNTYDLKRAIYHIEKGISILKGEIEKSNQTLYGVNRVIKPTECIDKRITFCIKNSSDTNILSLVNSIRSQIGKGYCLTKKQNDAINTVYKLAKLEAKNKNKK